VEDGRSIENGCTELDNWSQEGKIWRARSRSEVERNEVVVEICGWY